MKLSYSNRLNRFVCRAVIAIFALIASRGGPVAVAQTPAADGAVASPAKTSQDTPALALPEVLVSGYRGSLEQALNLKHDLAVEADTIPAEDIGKFPDQNLAESLQRIPGVAVTREEGEGREITAPNTYVSNQLTGLSKDTSGTTLYYEDRNGVSVSPALTAAVT